MMRRRRVIEVLLKGVAPLVVPLAAFLVLEAALGNSTRALAITESVPTLWLLAIAIWRRRVDPVVLIAVVGLGVALAISALSGGSALPIKLRRALFPGAAGLACLISVAVGKPLPTLLAARTGLAERLARVERGAAISERQLSVITMIFGFALLADAGAQIALALTISTTAFVGLARVATYAIIGAGLLASAGYVWWSRGRERAIGKRERARGKTVRES